MLRYCDIEADYKFLFLAAIMITRVVLYYLRCLYVVVPVVGHLDSIVAVAAAVIIYYRYIVVIIIIIIIIVVIIIIQSVTGRTRMSVSGRPSSFPRAFRVSTLYLSF
jgi:hypothetical protein